MIINKKIQWPFDKFIPIFLICPKKYFSLFSINLTLCFLSIELIYFLKIFKLFSLDKSLITIISLSFNSKKDYIVFWIKIGLLKWGIIIECFIIFSLLIS